MGKLRKCIWIVLLLLIFTLKMSVQAGNINDNEEKLLTSARGTFEYNGKTYVAKDEYVVELEGILASDEVDLTSEQVASLISKIFGNIGKGVNEGYLTPVDVNGEQNSALTEIDPPKSNAKAEESDLGSMNQTHSNNVMIQETDEFNTKEEKQNNQEKQAEKKILWIDSDTISSDENQSVQSNSEISTEYSAKSDKDIDHTQFMQNNLVDDKLQTEAVMKKGPLDCISQNWTVVIAVCSIIVLSLLGIGVANRIRKKILGGKITINNYIDIHSHILPGVDDGAKDEQETLKMVEMAYKSGIRKMIATPHYHIGHRHKSMEELQIIYENTQKLISRNYPDFELYLGNELYYSDGIIDRIENKKVYTLAGSKYVLIEFRLDESYSQILNSVTKIVRASYCPVLAHVERYKNLIMDQKRLQELKKAGAFLQMNFTSVKSNSKLIKQGYIDLLGTDCHDDEKRSPETKETIQSLSTFLTHEEIAKLLVENPGRIIDNKYIER